MLRRPAWKKRAGDMGDVTTTGIRAATGITGITRGGIAGTTTADIITIGTTVTGTIIIGATGSGLTIT